MKFNGGKRYKIFGNYIWIYTRRYFRMNIFPVAIVLGELGK